ncbi:MAG TPA: protein kinase [Ktedonobacterales bacterium]
MAERIGQQLGNYRLVRLLGRGGFAEVYLGEHVDRGTQAAIKVLHAQLTSKDIERFNTEASTIARLSHPHIVRLLEFATDEGTPFLVLDYAPGGTLRERHPRGTPLPVETILPYVRQACDALYYAHEEKLIHRDVKPENLLLSADGQVLLSDFGIATVAQSSHSQSTQEALGTITYMAPEQIQGKPRPASDLYALGIIVYEWLTGYPPFSGSFGEIATQHLFAPPPLRERVPELSEDVQDMLSIALAKDPHQRFANARAFATALEEATQEKPPLLFAITQITPPSLANEPTSPGTRNSSLADATRLDANQPVTGPTAPELPPTFSFPSAPSAQGATPTQPAVPVGAKASRRLLRSALVVVLALLVIVTSGVALALSRPSLFGGPNGSQTSNNGATTSAGGSPPGQGIGNASTSTATPAAGSDNNENPTSGPAKQPTSTTAPNTTQQPSLTPTTTPKPSSTPTNTSKPPPTPTNTPTPTCCPGTAPPGSYSKWWVDTFANAPGYYGAGANWHRVGTLYAATNYVFCKAWGSIVSDNSGNYNHWWLWTDLDTGGQGWVSAYYLTRWGNDVAKDNSGHVIPTC